MDNRIQDMEKTIEENGNYYSVVMKLKYEIPRKGAVSRSSETQKEILTELLNKLSNELCAVGTTNFLLRGQQGSTTLCTHEIKRENGRLDTQSRTGLRKRANLHFQIGKKSYAVLELDTLPEEPAPVEVKNNGSTIDRYFGISEIMNYIKDGFNYSAQKQVFTYITWSICKKEKSKKQEKDKKRNFSKSMMATVVAAAPVVGTVAATTVATAYKAGVKIAGKESVKIGIKVVSKEAAKTGTKTIIKAIPILGLACGAIFATIRIAHRDRDGAMLELASGAVSCIPGWGTAASIIMDVGIAGRDVYNVS